MADPESVLVKYTGEDGTDHSLAYEGTVAVAIVLDALGIQRGVFSDPDTGLIKPFSRSSLIPPGEYNLQVPISPYIPQSHVPRTTAHRSKSDLRNDSRFPSRQKHQHIQVPPFNPLDTISSSPDPGSGDPNDDDAGNSTSDLEQRSKKKRGNKGSEKNGDGRTRKRSKDNETRRDAKETEQGKGDRQGKQDKHDSERNEREKTKVNTENKQKGGSSGAEIQSERARDTGEGASLNQQPQTTKSTPVPPSVSTTNFVLHSASSSILGSKPLASNTPTTISATAPPSNASSTATTPSDSTGSFRTNLNSLDAHSMPRANSARFMSTFATSNNTTTQFPTTNQPSNPSVYSVPSFASKSFSGQPTKDGTNMPFQSLSQLLENSNTGSRVQITPQSVANDKAQPQSGAPLSDQANPSNPSVSASADNPTTTKSNSTAPKRRKLFSNDKRIFSYFPSLISPDGTANTAHQTFFPPTKVNNTTNSSLPTTNPTSTNPLTTNTDPLKTTNTANITTNTTNTADTTSTNTSNTNNINTKPNTNNSNTKPNTSPNITTTNTANSDTIEPIFDDFFDMTYTPVQKPRAPTINFDSYPHYIVKVLKSFQNDPSYGSLQEELLKLYEEEKGKYSLQFFCATASCAPIKLVLHTLRKRIGGKRPRNMSGFLKWLEEQDVQGYNSQGYSSQG